MDIDILFYNDDIIQENSLIIPHPQLHERRFTLEPMVEIAPKFIHPMFKKMITILLEECKDISKVVRLNR